MKTTLFLLSCLGLHQLAAQTRLAGLVHDNQSHPVPYASVLLLNATDSTLVKGTLTGSDGTFQLNDLPAGRYQLTVQMLGFQEYRSEALEWRAGASAPDLGPIVLLENTAQLHEVTIVAKKPFFEQKIDRLVVNVAGSITSAGATALDVLERSPGVIVNRQNNAIALAGKEGVVVMINGKINRMPVEAVVQLLEGMPAGNIEKIELITTPPANFDAEGNAGYINIVLKQSADRGLNGSYNLSGGFGRGDVASAGINFNYRKNRLNLYGDYAFSREAQEQIFAIDRLVLLNGNTLRTDTRTVRDPLQRNHQARLGMDFSLSPKTVLGLLVSGYDNRWSMDAVNRSTISINGQPDTLLRIDNDEVNHWRHLGGNLNLQHRFREGEALTFDADYLHYENENPTNYQTEYTDAQGGFLFGEQTFSGKVTPIRVGVARLDYTRPFSAKLKMEAGIKGTLARFDNDVTVYRLVNGAPVNDPDLTAQYRLEEDISAAYAAFDLKLDDQTDLKLGLRYEYTNSNLGTAEQANIVDRHYGNLFPSLFLSRSFNDQHSANLSYSRRITRPTFNDMAPFVIFLDPYTFFSGNAALQPSISNTLKLDYRFKTALLSVQYAVEDSAIARFQARVVEGTNQQLIAAENMKNRKTASVTLALPWQPAAWWNMQNNLVGTWQEVNAYLDGEPVQVRAQNLQVVWINSFTLPRDFSAELVGFYQSKGLFGTTVALPIAGMNIGFQKKFGERWGTLRFGIDDLFNSIKFRGKIDLPEYNLVSESDFDFSQRTFKLSYTRNFGNKKLASKRQRDTGAEEERQRVN